MARELRRLLIEPQRLALRSEAGGTVPLLREEEHYLRRVLRLRPGDPVLVVDGCGGLWQGLVGDGARLEALQQLQGMPLPPPSPRLCLALALPRQDVEVVWRMATELGIDGLQPLVADRCQGSGRRQPLERWFTVIREATEQCERLWMPQLDGPETAADWLSRPLEGVRLLATTRRPQLIPLEQALAPGDGRASKPESVTLAIGPEGGWSPVEEERAEAAGWCPVSLGDTILRTTTAAVAGVSRLAAWRRLSF